MLRNNELKRRLGYTDPKSFCRFDSSEVLHGKDWKKRKLELWERCGGRCEYVNPVTLERCRSEADDPEHIRKRSNTRNDQLKNLMALCRRHHNLKHAARKPRFGEHLEVR